MTPRQRIAGRAVRAAHAIGRSVRRAEQAVATGLRRRRRRQAVRRAGEAALAAGAAVLATRAIREAEALLARSIEGRRSGSRLGFSVTLPIDPERAIARLADALRAEGFGIITRTDLHTTFREKLGVSFRPYVLLGVCHPTLAHRALSADPEAGLLLPCTATVEDAGGGMTIVRVADPKALLGAPAVRRRPAVMALAREARRRLEGAMASLSAHAGAAIL